MATQYIDPVCKMTVDPQIAKYTSVYQGYTYYFCSAGCKASFDKNPAQYASLQGPDKALHDS